jgi:hypothetical protein
MDLNYEKDLAIDPGMLDEEWLRQPGIYMKYAIDAKNKMLEAELEKELADQAVFAFTHRKQALENLVKLYLGEYFSTPREPKQIIAEGKRFTDIKTDRTASQAKERLNRRSAIRKRAK